AAQGSVLLEKREVSLLENKAYFDALLARINGAQSGILISMYIFKTTSKANSSANKIKEALIKAARRGVHVKVLLEIEGGQSSSLNKENRYTADGLTKGGVKVYFDSPGRRTHTKAIVIDGRYTFIGSHNLTTGALHYNNELSLMIDSVEVARETARYIEEIIALKKS
ncbi:MAG: phospholipase D-like domain-containing protein, partial [Nitrospirota bacterium]|nr:phospholipase D-like domain-containing protein [Nitrospirota bacterium]